MKTIGKTAFNLIPFIRIIKMKNLLTEDAKKQLGILWNCFYYIEIGWLLWAFKIKL